jgi:DNA-binding MarR family transcriptional regulator
MAGGGACALLALLEAAEMLQGRLEAALEAVGLSPAKYQALDALVRAGESIALGALAGRLRCVRSNVTQLADRLEADGLMKRVDDPTDRRAIRAVVTPLGAERHRAGAAAIDRMQKELAARVSPDDRAAFLRVLSTLK